MRRATTFTLLTCLLLLAGCTEIPNQPNQPATPHPIATFDSTLKKPITLGSFSTPPDPTPSLRATIPPTAVPSVVPTISPIPSITTRPSSSPQPPSTACGQTEIQQLVDNVSEDNLRAYLTKLVDDPNTPGDDEKISRWGGTPGNNTAVAYIKSHFEGIGVDSYYQAYQYGPYALKNIIGRVAGRDPNSFYVVSGHMDSTGQMSGSNAIAPGADDDGTGTVLVMEAARVLKAFAPCLKTSIEFAAFNGEELGLTGSYYYVHNLTGKTVKGNLNFDMVANNANDACVDFLYKPYNGGDILANKLSDVNRKYRIGLQGGVQSSSMSNSDHGSFWDANIPAIFAFECSFSPYYHSVNDKTTHIDFHQLRQTTQTAVAALAELASQ